MTGPDDDAIGDELRTLFDDQRLAVHPVPDPDGIVAGARRRRRRRSVLVSSAGTLVLAGLVGGGLALSGLGGDGAPAPNVAAPTTTEEPTRAEPPPPTAESEPPPTQSPVEESTSPPESPSTPSPTASPTGEPNPDTTEVTEPHRGGVLTGGPALGPDGYRSLNLGMSYQEAVDTGMVQPGAGPPGTGSCNTYRLTGTSAVSTVTMLGGEGIVRFTSSGARTPEGIGAGSSVRQARGAYPDLAASSSGYTASANATASYVFAASGDTVTGLELSSDGAGC